MFEDAIHILSNRIAQIKKALPSETERDRLIAEKVSCETAIHTLRYCAKHRIGPHLKVVELPPIIGHGMSFYRLMIDNELDDERCWTRVDDIGGESAEFIEGSKILHR